MALRVIEGGWKSDEARVEVLALCDETGNDAEDIYSALDEIEQRVSYLKRRSMRLMHRATAARIEMSALMGGDAA